MASSAQSSQQPCDGQAGVSLVEIVIAMFILAATSMAILPLMMGAVQASATNRDLLAANAFANARLAMLQAAFPNTAGNSCAAVTATAANDLKDPAASGTTASVTFGACPSSYPATVAVSVKAFRPNSTQAVLSLDSAILVATG